MSIETEQLYQIKYTVDGEEESDILSATTAGDAIAALKHRHLVTPALPPVSKLRITSVKEYSTKGEES